MKYFITVNMQESLRFLFWSRYGKDGNIIAYGNSFCIIVCFRKKLFSVSLVCFVFRNNYILCILFTIFCIQTCNGWKAKYRAIVIFINTSYSFCEKVNERFKDFKCKLFHCIPNYFFDKLYDYSLKIIYNAKIRSITVQSY